MLERTPLSPAQIKAFRRTGNLALALSPASVDDGILCHCMGISRGTLLGAMESGCQTVDALSARTGAGTVCGGCLPRLAELTAETLWQSVRCMDVIDRARRVKSFRFEIPSHHPAGTVRPGQRILVQAVIGGVAVQRSYTLTSPVTEQRYYEITVQREPHGLTSGWRSRRCGRVSRSRSCRRPGPAIPSDPRPLVCLVGGIG